MSTVVGVHGLGVSTRGDRPGDVSVVELFLGGKSGLFSPCPAKQPSLSVNATGNAQVSIIAMQVRGRAAALASAAPRRPAHLCDCPPQGMPLLDGADEPLASVRSAEGDVKIELAHDGFRGNFTTSTEGEVFASARPPSPCAQLERAGPRSPPRTPQASTTPRWRQPV